MFDKKGVFWFLGLTFGLTWLLDLVIYLRGGLGAPGAINVVQLQMMMPALSAIVLGLFFLPQSPIYHRRPAGRGRWFYYIYLLFTVIIAFTSMGTLLAPEAMPPAVAYAPLLPSVLGLLVLVVLRFAAGRQAMDRVWLAWGNWRCWLLFGLGFVAYYVLQAALNAFTGLGSASFGPNLTPKGASSGTYLILGAMQILGMSILGIVIGFGEEYGWRGYLQSELFKLGRVRGVLLMGLIWGTYHWPVILMGWNYPGYPLLGLVLMVLWCTADGIVLSYAVLKSGSVLLAAFLHAVGNVIMSPIVELGFRPFDRVFSFFSGIYGIATLAVIAFFILRDPIWRGKGGNLAQPTPAPIAMAVSGNPGAVEKAADQVKLGTTS
jgi:membrane protease YdiL (CAAX protease family)